MFKHWKSLKILFLNVQEGTGSEYKDCCGIYKKLVSNYEFSKSDNFKKLPVLA